MILAVNNTIAGNTIIKQSPLLNFILSASRACIVPVAGRIAIDSSHYDQASRGDDRNPDFFRHKKSPFYCCLLGYKPVFRMFSSPFLKNPWKKIDSTMKSFLLTSLSLGSGPVSPDLSA